MNYLWSALRLVYRYPRYQSKRFKIFFCCISSRVYCEYLSKWRKLTMTRLKTWKTATPYSTRRETWKLKASDWSMSCAPSAWILSLKTLTNASRIPNWRESESILRLSSGFTNSSSINLLWEATLIWLRGWKHWIEIQVDLSSLQNWGMFSWMLLIRWLMYKWMNLLLLMRPQMDRFHTRRSSEASWQDEKLVEDSPTSMFSRTLLSLCTRAHIIWWGFL